MRRLAVFVLALAGCPPPAHYLITDVTVARAPVADALVAADCGRPYGADAALRTDATGRARLPIRGPATANRCLVTVAKPGYQTVEIGGVSLCRTAACPPTEVELAPDDALAVFERPEPPRAEPVRTYARPAEMAR